MTTISVQAKPNTHPCFDGCDATHKYARIHLPVARDCNIKCNYCRRKFDCVNESRPGVTSKVLSPKEALERCLLARERVAHLTVVGIAGPGDALASSSIDNTLETLRLVKESWSGAVFCLSTNGLMLPDYAQTLKDAGVSHITVTVNSLRPETAMRIYRHIDYKGERLTGKEAVATLLQRQLDGIRSVSALGITCKVNTVLIKGLNDSQMTEIAEGVKAAGASLMNIMQLIPVKDTLFESIPIVSNAELNAVRTKAESILPQMRHCAQCRADAVGTLDNDISRTFGANDEARDETSTEFARQGRRATQIPQFTTQTVSARMRIAVASKTGRLVDEHFGHAEAFYIYEWKDGAASFVEKRETGDKYCGEVQGCAEGYSSSDSHAAKFASVLKAVSDCDAVLALRIGDAPERLLNAHGIRVFMTYDYIEDAVKNAHTALTGGNVEGLAE